MDEAEEAYCAKIYTAKCEEYGSKRMSGVRIFDKVGNPYQIKYLEVAEKLRLERRQVREQASKDV